MCAVTRVMVLNISLNLNTCKLVFLLFRLNDNDYRPMRFLSRVSTGIFYNISFIPQMNFTHMTFIPYVRFIINILGMVRRMVDYSGPTFLVFLAFVFLALMLLRGMNFETIQGGF